MASVSYWYDVSSTLRLKQAKAKRLKTMRCTRMLVVFVAVAAMASVAHGQEQKCGPVSSRPLSKCSLKLKLLSIGAASAETIAKATHPVTKAAVPKNAKASLCADGTDFGVSEFQLAPQTAAGAFALPRQSSKESTLKSIHGEIGGSLPAESTGLQQVNAAAGATSKSGKTSIFIQTNHATIQEPH